MKGQVNQDGWKLNGTQHLLAYAHDINILGGSVHTIKKNTETLVVASKEIGLEVNVDKTKYMVMSRDLNAGRSHNLKIHNSFFERVGEFKYLGTNLNQNPIQEDIKSRLRECLISFGAESFVFQSAIQNFKDYTQNHNFICCFVWVRNLVAHIEGGI